MWEIAQLAIGIYLGGLALIGTCLGIEELVTRHRERQREKAWKQ